MFEAFREAERKTHSLFPARTQLWMTRCPPVSPQLSPLSWCLLTRTRNSCAGALLVQLLLGPVALSLYPGTP